MPLTDRDVNTPGRSSRASSMSASSRNCSKLPPNAVPTKTDMPTSAPGVMSMLKSSTELGTESLIMPGSRFSAQNRASSRRSGTASRMSTGSTHSQPSRPASGHHSHHAWPSISSGGRRMSITSNFSSLNAAQHYLDSIPPPSLGNLSEPASVAPPALYFRDNGRSMSLTNSIHQPLGLANYRSLSSLRGQEPYPRPRSPYRYPTRLKRPGYRPSSPAMSDITGGLSYRGHHHRPGSGLRMAHGTHGSQGSHGGRGPLVHQNFRPSPLYYGPRNRSSPSAHSIGPLENMPGMYPPSLPVSRQGTPSVPDHTLPMMTPTDSVAASSSQQSSDPPSSAPPTPGNQATCSSTEPIITSNMPARNRRGSSASATVPAYYDYSEQFQPIPKEIRRVSQSPLLTPPSMGFVQRIRTILEERRGHDRLCPHAHAVSPEDLADEPPEHADEVHELPASPVVKRITRELIQSTLQPTSESGYSVTPTMTATLKTKVQTPDPGSNVPPASSPPEPLPVPTGGIDIAHERGLSKASGNGSARSDTTTATAVMDYALRYSPPLEQLLSFEAGNTMSDVLRNYGNEDTHMSTVIEEPTEPATIATAEVEVTAPTPTQPKWKPNFDTPPHLLRPQSALVASSIYSSSNVDSSSRHSTPMVLSQWPLSVAIEEQPVAQQTQESTSQCDPKSELRIGSALVAKDTRSELSDPPNRAPIAERRPLVKTAEFLTSPVSPLSEVNVDRFNTFSPSPVSPLLSPELAMNKRDSNASSIWSYRKSVSKRPDSPASIGSTRASIRELDIPTDHDPGRDNTTDLRFSALGFRPLTRYLDDVKEEPSLEASTVDLKASTFKFPLPQRKSSLAHYEEFRLSRESKRNASVELVKITASRAGSVATAESQLLKDSPLRVPPGAVTLSDLRSIPSLHFSRVDLFSKLHEALEIHPESTDGEHFDVPNELRVRPESTGVMRLKYRSFFESLDNMANDPVATSQTRCLGEEECEISSILNGLRPQTRQIVLPKIQQWTPDDLMAEINRLSIPSINGLTQRLSELLPSLRRYYGEHGEAMDEDETVRSALDEIRRLGAELIPETRENTSSFGDDSGNLYEDATSTQSPSTGRSGSSSLEKVRTRPRSASSPGSVPGTPLAELEALAPAILRSHSLSHRVNGHLRDSCVMAEYSRSSRRSLLGSPPESRPWNLDTSYPWANNIPAIDISLPAPSLRRDHIKPRPSRLRLRDDAVDSLGLTADITVATATVSSELTEATSGGDTFSQAISHRRRYSKRSILGSISRKIRLPRGTSIDNSGYATGPDILRGEDRIVDPGDRYPTTGLSPPLALNIDEVRSFFSDDSSHLETEVTPRAVGLRKRFSNLKTKLPPMSRTHSALEQRAAPSGPILRRSNSLFFARSTHKPNDAAGLDVYIDEASGMPKTEVRAKKLVNRMKTLWYRGGELLRTLSGKRKQRESDNWDDSGESAIWSNV